MQSPFGLLTRAHARNRNRQRSITSRSTRTITKDVSMRETRCLGSRGSGRPDKRFVQAGLSAFGGIPVDDAALGCLINGRDHCPHIFRFRFRTGARDAFLHFAQARQDASVAQGAHSCLTSAFGGGFCIGHWKTKNCERGGSRRGRRVSRRDPLGCGGRQRLTRRRGRSEAALRYRRSCGRSFQTPSPGPPARLPSRLAALAPRL